MQENRTFVANNATKKGLTSIVIYSLIGIVTLLFGIFKFYLFFIAPSPDKGAVAASIFCIGIILFAPAANYYFELPKE